MIDIDAAAPGARATGTGAPAAGTAGTTRGPIDALTAEALDKAATMIEILPWLERFQGECMVIKYGGHAMADEALRRAFAQDIVFLRYVGIRPVIVHGGGPQIDNVLRRLGIEPAFAAGLRVTPPETMDVVRMVLAGQVGGDIVKLINRHGPYAIGLSGLDANLLTAERRSVWVDGERVDLGHVGDITAVDAGALHGLLADGRIPVVTGIARGVHGGGGFQGAGGPATQGPDNTDNTDSTEHLESTDRLGGTDGTAGADTEILNVNADTVAAALAIATDAAKLVMLTDVGGLCPGWPDSDEVVAELTAGELGKLLPELSAGMIPKMEACLRAVREGVPEAHVLDGRVPHALLLEMFADGIGTKVVPE
jgi:acetylglutamate kinase